MKTAAELVADLRRPWRHGEHVDASGIVLEDPLILDGMDIRGVDLTGAILKGGLSAKGARFAGLAWLRGIKVTGQCDLSDAHFRIDFRGDDMTAREIRLDRCNVKGVLALARARLDILSLRDAVVMANLTLENASVGETVDMTGTEILGGLWTEGARLCGMKDQGAMVSGRVG